MPRKPAPPLAVVDPAGLLDRALPPEPVPVVVVPPRPTTGQLLMRLRTLLAERTGEPWHAVARLRPLSEEPYCSFQVYARLPGANEWLGEYTAEADEGDLIGIVDDLVAIRADPTRQQPAAPRADVRDADGEVTVQSGLVGQSRNVQLANGDVVSVNVRALPPKESESQERERVEREIDAFEKVMVMVEKAEVVGYNGSFYQLTPGPNVVPRPIADLYFQSWKDSSAARARMSVTLSDDQNRAWIARENRGY